jgi:predicted GNAT family N-acyltransferase|tara:strand:- start:958 stop:1374 length:417 start_codon:yes stop_codon:yes gene_type:complete
MIRVETTEFEPYADSIKAIRFEVFVDEQNVPPELEIDGLDPECLHALAFNEDTSIATGRLLKDGHIGRVAVLASYRNQGIGTLIMKSLINAARNRSFQSVILSSQTQAIPFYEQLDFQTQGPIYQEAGIDHIDMVLKL